VGTVSVLLSVMHEYFKKYQDKFFKSEEVICSDFCVARGVPVNNAVQVPPRDFCCTSLQGRYLLCIYLPLADEFQETADPRKQLLANQSTDLQASGRNRGSFS